MSQTKYVVILLFLMQVMVAAAQSNGGDCVAIRVKAEVLTSPITGKKSVLKINFDERGDFEIKVLNSNKKFTELKKLEVSDLEPGKYNLIILDLKRTDRCAYIQKITIEGK
jgi:hypothetical protein